MRKECTEFSTVGELRRFIADLPDTMPVCRLTNGHYQVHLIGGVFGFAGELPIGREGATQVVLELTA